MVLLHSIPLNIQQLFQNFGSTVKMKKGNSIFREGERAENIFLIEQGTVQISKETEHGKELTLRICGPHALISESAMFCTVSYHTTSSKTLEDTQLLSLHTDTLGQLLTENPPLMLEYIKWLQTENLKHQSRLRDLMLNGKKGALFSTLIRLANTYGEFRSDNEVFINFSLTNTDIANLCATSREMINRMLNDLKNYHILTFDKGYITINDIQFLKDEIACENCPLTICRID